MTKQGKALRTIANSLGLEVFTYAPGDGVARYRFFLKGEDASMYSSSNELFTALGPKEARAFLCGFNKGSGIPN